MITERTKPNFQPWDETAKRSESHGIEVATYANGPDGYRPYMECTCGAGFRGYSWEEVGAEMDDHLSGT